MKSDSDLQHEVQDALAGLFAVPAESVEVRVSEGIVTLAGIVRNDLETWKLDDAVMGVQGVKSLVNDTVVSTESTHQPDADIARGWFA